MDIVYITRFLVLAGITLLQGVYCGRLQVSGDHLVKDGRRVFLSGVNLAWIDYAKDFGNHGFAAQKISYEKYLRELSASGGNSMRVWLHMEGENTPYFDHTGRVAGLDKEGTFISDIKEMLGIAQKHNILVFFCLWNAALKLPPPLAGLIRDTMKLQTYIDHALIPLVKAVHAHPAVGGWDIMNEPEGFLNTDRVSADPCYDASHLKRDGAGWTSKSFNYEDILRFINWQADAIRQVDPGALVTVGSWKMQAVTSKMGGHGHYSDHCLTQAGGRPHGVLQVYQAHTYDDKGHFDQLSPFRHEKSDFGLGKPLIIAEFAAKSGGGMKIEGMFQYAYNHGYVGAWSWSGTDHYYGDTWADQKRGVASIRNNHDINKGTIDFNL